MPAITDDDAHKAEFGFALSKSWAGLRARPKTYMRAIVASLVVFPLSFAAVGGFLTGSASPAVVTLVTFLLAAPGSVVIGASIASALGKLDTPERPLKHRVASFRAEVATPRPKGRVVYEATRSERDIPIVATATEANVQAWSTCEHPDCLEAFVRAHRHEDP